MHPENKGRGIATALISEGIEYAKRVKVPILVMAYKAGRGVYLRLKFEEVEKANLVGILK